MDLDFDYTARWKTQRYYQERIRLNSPIKRNGCVVASHSPRQQSVLNRTKMRCFNKTCVMIHASVAFLHNSNENDECSSLSTNYFYDWKCGKRKSTRKTLWVNQPRNCVSVAGCIVAIVSEYCPWLNSNKFSASENESHSAKCLYLRSASETHLQWRQKMGEGKRRAMKNGNNATPDLGYARIGWCCGRKANTQINN